MKAQGGAALERMAAAMAAGLAPIDGEAMDAAEAHRQHIDAAFYPCPPAMHRGLAELYVSDPRFTATYESIVPGLAQFLHDAIVANAARQEALSQLS